MRNFIPAQRARTPSYSTAIANQGFLQNQADETNRRRRHAQMRAPLDMYDTYVNLTDHNPISDVLRKTNIGKNSESVQAARAAEAADAAKNAAAVAQNAPGPAAAATAAAKAPAAADMAGSGVSAAMQGGKGGSDALAAAVAANNATKTATNVAAKGAGMASKAIPIVGGALSAGLNYADEKAKGSDDWRVAGKTLGGAAPAALLSTAPMLAAAGPVGWAGIAGLAALSLYGMIG
jgi:hypothetical protein